KRSGSGYCPGCPLWSRHACASKRQAEVEITARVVAIILFLMLTSPIGAHMIGRASVRELKKPDQAPQNDS
ncbi:MAG: monovalent cation/H(+) antiporter subunit G, partial [Pseudomonadota bacterium]